MDQNKLPVQSICQYLLERPVSRKSRNFVHADHKDEYYWSKRRKNNEAARRSREKRRVNDLILEHRVLELLQENKELKCLLLQMKVKDGAIKLTDLPPEISSMKCDFTLFGNSKMEDWPNNSQLSAQDIANKTADLLGINNMLSKTLGCRPLQHFPSSILLNHQTHSNGDPLLNSLAAGTNTMMPTNLCLKSSSKSASSSNGEFQSKNANMQFSLKSDLPSPSQSSEKHETDFRERYQPRKFGKVQANQSHVSVGVCNPMPAITHTDVKPLTNPYLSSPSQYANNTALSDVMIQACKSVVKSETVGEKNSESKVQGILSNTSFVVSQLPSGQFIVSPIQSSLPRTSNDEELTKKHKLSPSSDETHDYDKKPFTSKEIEESDDFKAASTLATLAQQNMVQDCYEAEKTDSQDEAKSSSAASLPHKLRFKNSSCSSESS